MQSPEIGSPPAAATLTLVQGDEWARVFTLRADSATGTPLNLTGAAFTATIHRDIGGALEATLPVVVVDALLGQVKVTISEVVSQALTAADHAADRVGRHWLTLRMVNNVGYTQTLLRAQIRMVKGLA